MQVLRLLLQHLRVADDGVEGGSQLVGHVGQKLRLVVTGDRELATLQFEVSEQTGSLEGQGRLDGKRLQDVNDLRGKLAWNLPVEGQAPDDLVFAEQGHS